MYVSICMHPYIIYMCAYIGSLNTAIVLNQVNVEASKRIAYVMQR